MRPVYDPTLMSRFMQLISPNTSFSARFVPKRVNRTGYDTSERKAMVIQSIELQAGYDLPLKFADNGRNLRGLPAAPEQLRDDPYLRRGDLLAVALKHDGDVCTAIYVDLDAEQIANGGLALVVGALDRKGVHHLVEISSSGEGTHVWVPFGQTLGAIKATRWMKKLLANAGVQKKSKKSPGHYDEVKPSGGDGGLIIIPHFFETGRSCLAQLNDSVAVPLNRKAAGQAIESFVQKPSVLDDVKSFELPETSRSPSQVRKTVSTDGAVTVEDLVPEFRPLSASELGQELGLVRWAVKRNARLDKLATQAASDAGGGRSEATWMLLSSLLLDHWFQPEAVAAYCADWPRNRKTSLARELSRVISKHGAESFLTTIHALRPTTLTPQELVSKYKDASFDSLSYREQQQRLASCAVETIVRDAPQTEKLLLLINLPTGLEKSTVHAPMLARALAASLSGDTLPVVLRRERRKDVVATKKLLSTAPLNVAVSEDWFRQVRGDVSMRVRQCDYAASPAIEGPFRSHFPAHPGSVASAFGFGTAAECPLAMGDRWDREKFESYRKISKKLARQPCLAGCPRVSCSMHPGALTESLKAGARIVVATHDSERAPEHQVTISDERPHDLLVVHSFEVTKVETDYAVSPIDRVVKLLRFAGLDPRADELKPIRRALRDAYDEAAKSTSDTYRRKPIQELYWTEDDVSKIADTMLCNPARRALLVAYVREAKLYPQDRNAAIDDTGDNLDTLVHRDLQAIRQLCSGNDALWFWSAGPNRALRIHVAENRWRETLKQTSRMYISLDASASGHYSSAAIPPDVSWKMLNFERPLYTGLQISFDDDSITKGVATSNLGKQIDYTLRCLERLRAENFDGDILIVTHQKAETHLLTALRRDDTIASRFDVITPGATEQIGGAKRKLFIDHFGAIKGANDYRACSAVIITHKHNLPHEQAAALALAIFPDLRVLQTSQGSESCYVELPRQWTPTRRGVKGKHASKRAMYSQQSDLTYSAEVGYVKRSHLATEIVQAIMRFELRSDFNAKVRAFIPLGNETELAVEILREIPGARIVPLTETPRRTYFHRFFGQGGTGKYSAQVEPDLDTPFIDREDDEVYMAPDDVAFDDDDVDSTSVAN